MPPARLQPCSRPHENGRLRQCTCGLRCGAANGSRVHQGACILPLTLDISPRLRRCLWHVTRFQAISRRAECLRMMERFDEAAGLCCVGGVVFGFKPQRRRIPTAAAKGTGQQGGGGECFFVERCVVDTATRMKSSGSWRRSRSRQRWQHEKTGVSHASCVD